MKRRKKSIFRALKAFLFFCGAGGWEMEDVWMLLAFFLMFRILGFVFCFVYSSCFFPPLIGCTDLAQEIKRISLLMLLPMLS